MSKKEISFTEGPVFQSLLRFAIPVLGALILQAAYGAVDLLIVGKFGNASSISAVGTGSSFMQMATFIITSLAMGSTVIIGHHIGEQKTKRSRKCGRNYNHSFSDHCCHHDICTGICRRRNCASFTGTG